MCVGDVGGGDDVGGDGLVEVVGEGLAIDVAGEVVDVGGGAGVRGEVVAGGEDEVLAALVGLVP